MAKKIINNFRPIPFYFLNDTIEKEEIDRQLLLMKASGTSGFFLHSRCGLSEFGYGNKKWYDDLEYIITKSKTLGLEPWLFDEDSYPSGNGGGRIAIEHPEYIAQKINIEKLEIDENGQINKIFSDCKPLRAYEVMNCDGKLITKDLTNCFGVVRQDWFSKADKYNYYLGQNNKEHNRSATYNPKIIFHAEQLNKNSKVFIAFTTRCYTINRFGSITDNLNRKSVDLFKKYAYESYFNNLSKESIKSIPGFFTDEPVAGGMLPWTDSFEKEFKKEKGYKIEENYFHMVEDINEKSEIVRKDYWQVASKMFTDNYVKNLKKYCNKNNMLFTGHLEAEESPFYQALKCVNVYESLWDFDIPGFDILCDKIGSRADPSLIFGSKLVSSVANQKGDKLSLCEMFAVNPYNFNIDGMKKVANWIFAMGLKICVPHAFYYGYSGLRKKDAGKSFFFQDPEFNNFNIFSSYVNTIGKRMNELKSSSNTLVVFPNWEFASLAKVDKNKSDILQDKLFSIIKLLIENHIEFDITDCNYVNKHFKFNQAKVGKILYKNIIYISLNSKVMLPIKKKIYKLKSYIFNTTFNDLDIIKLKKTSNYTTLESIKGDEKNIISFKKQLKDKKEIYLFNTVSDNTIVSFKTNENVLLFDPETEKTYTLKKDDGEVIISFEGYKSYFLILNEKITTDFEVYKPCEFNKKVCEFEKNPQWSYIPNKNVKCLIEKYDILVKYNDDVREYKNENNSFFREIYGANLFKRYNDLPRPLYDNSKINLFNYPIWGKFTAKFEIENGTTMLFEQNTFHGNYELYINGKIVDKNSFKKEKVYDFRNLICDVSSYLINGSNLLEVVFNNAEEDDGINSEIYFL